MTASNQIVNRLIDSAVKFADIGLFDAAIGRIELAEQWIESDIMQYSQDNRDRLRGRISDVKDWLRRISSGLSNRVPEA